MARRCPTLTALSLMLVSTLASAQPESEEERAAERVHYTRYVHLRSEVAEEDGVSSPRI